MSGSITRGSTVGNVAIVLLLHSLRSAADWSARFYAVRGSPRAAGNNH